MFWLFLYCAVIAGTVFLFQFVMLLVGFGLDGADGDLPHDIGGDVDMPHDVHLDDGHAGDIDHETGNLDHHSTWLFGVISIRTVVAAVTMFGLVGMAALSAMEPAKGAVLPYLYAIVLAVGGGAAAMFGVHFVMRSLYKLGADGKVRTQNALGRTATVYLPIPASGDGSGKIQIRMQGRLVELAATTDVAQTLPTGSTVRVVGVIGGATVRVEPVRTDAKASEPVSS